MCPIELLRLDFNHQMWVPIVQVIQYFFGRLNFVFVRYILEGKELEFYMKKIQRKKGKGAGGA